ncbi:MAG: peptidoglycan DD-metalloendopeptidase family protein [Christensenellales bacterium]
MRKTKQWLCIILIAALCLLPLQALGVTGTGAQALSSLSILADQEEIELFPAFSPDVSTYLCRVDEKTKSVRIQARAEAPYEVILLEDTVELKDGVNTALIGCSGERGVLFYTLIIERVDEEQTAERIYFSERLVHLKKDDITKITPQAYPEDAFLPALLFESSDEAVVSVNDFGVLVANGNGMATVSAMAADGSMRTQCTVCVSDMTIEGFEVPLVHEQGATYTLRGLVQNGGGIRSVAVYIYDADKIPTESILWEQALKELESTGVDSEEAQPDSGEGDSDEASEVEEQPEDASGEPADDDETEHETNTANLNRLLARARDAAWEEAMEMEHEEPWEENEINLTSIDYYIRFNKLTEGNKVIEIRACDEEDNTTILCRQPFSVQAKQQEEGDVNPPAQSNPASKPSAQPGTPTPSQPNAPKPTQPASPVPNPTPAPTPAPDPAPSEGYGWPVAGYGLVTQYYSGGHPAMDISYSGTSLGHLGGSTPAILASKAGTVEYAYAGCTHTRQSSGCCNGGTGYGGYGNCVLIRHEDGSKTFYAHLDAGQVYVSAGQSVTKGQTIGLMGNTGITSGNTGIHLHFEIWINGSKVNPSNYL